MCWSWCLFRLQLCLFVIIFQKTVRNPYVDIFVAIITVPTLILLALLLDANIQEKFGSEDDTSTKSSFIVIIFGFGFLVLSLLVCGCIMHKMGMCLWTRTSQGDNDELSTNVNASSGALRISNFSSSGSRRANECTHIIDMPPSYETIINGYKCDLVANDAVSSITSMTEMSAAAPPPAYESLGLEHHEMPLRATSNHIWSRGSQYSSRYNF